MTLGLDPKLEGKIPTRFVFPTQYKISQNFGENPQIYLPIGYQGHNGIDLSCPTGSVVIAPCDITISEIDLTNVNGYGISFKARTEPFSVDGVSYCLEMVFGHLQSVSSLNIGDEIMALTQVAISDNTGQLTTGPHLHWGVRVLYQDGPAWRVFNTGNGYGGYIDQASLIDYKAVLPTLDGHVVYAGNPIGAQYFLFEAGKFQWIPDEYAMSAGGFLFDEGVKTYPELFNPAVKTVYTFDATTKQAKLTKQTYKLLVEQYARAKLLYKKYNP